MFNLLAETVLPSWVVNSFPIIKFILLILILLAAIALIVVVLMQETEDGSGTTNSITGIKDSYYAQNKGANKEGRLRKITIILSIFIAVAVIIFFILTRIYPGSIWG